jgi:exonuclease III
MVQLFNVDNQERIKKLWIGTWNVLTLYKGGAMRKLDKVLQEYRMDITAMQEIRWSGQEILERRHLVWTSHH